MSISGSLIWLDFIQTKNVFKDKLRFAALLKINTLG